MNEFFFALRQKSCIQNFNSNQVNLSLAIAKYSRWIPIRYFTTKTASNSQIRNLFLGGGISCTANSHYVPQSGGDCLGGEVPEDDRLVHGAAGQHVLRTRVPRQRQHSVLQERVAWDYHSVLKRRSHEINTSFRQYFQIRFRIRKGNW